MTINSVFDYSSTAGSNVDIAGNGIQGSSNISLGNDVFQNILAQIALGLVTRGSDIATASTVDFTAATTRSLLHDLTGTTTVTAVTMTAGWWRLCRAQGAFQLTASSTLVVNGSTSVNDTTTAGDLLLFFGYSASTVRVWRIPGGTPALGFTSTPTAAGTTTLTQASSRAQEFTGTTTQTVVLPVVSTLQLGTSFTIINQSTGIVTVQSSGGNTILALMPKGVAVFTSNANSGTGASVWDMTGPSGNGIDLGAVGQVRFPATQNASADANTLDDYEEGSWTPVLNFGGATTGITYGTQAGSYTKIGRYVFGTGDIILTSKGSATGNATITGLPFTVAGGNGALGTGFSQNMSSWQAWLGALFNSTSQINLYFSSATGVTAISNSNFTNTSEIQFSFAYQV